MNKKKLVIAISLIVIVVAVVVGVICIKSGSNSVSEIDKIVQSDVSLAEKTNKISELTAGKKADCEKMKVQIIETLKSLYKNEVKEYVSDDEMISEFEDYYSDSIEKIESKMDFYNVKNAIEYGSGSYASVDIASDEYNEFATFYDEISEIYNQLKALG